MMMGLKRVSLGRGLGRCTLCSLVATMRIDARRGRQLLLSDRHTNREEEIGRFLLFGRECRALKKASEVVGCLGKYKWMLWYKSTLCRHKQRGLLLLLILPLLLFDKQQQQPTTTRSRRALLFFFSLVFDLLHH